MIVDYISNMSPSHKSPLDLKCEQCTGPNLSCAEIRVLIRMIEGNEDQTQQSIPLGHKGYDTMSITNYSKKLSCWVDDT